MTSCMCYTIANEGKAKGFPRREHTMTSKSILDKVVNETWDDEHYDSIEQVVIESVLTSADMGRLFGELCEAMNGVSDFDDEAVRFISEMVGKYIDQFNPQPMA